MKKATLVLCIICCAFASYSQNTNQSLKKILNRASAAVESKDIEGAIEEYKKALQIDKDNTIVLQKLGELYESLSQYKNAMDCYNRFLALAPNAPEANYLETKRDKLEYKMEREKKESGEIESLKATWHTTGKNWWVFSMDELEGNIRVTVTPGSALYDKDFITKTVLATRTGKKISFSFSTDKISILSKTG